jgi:16S rRNA processing protein RimM
MPQNTNRLLLGTIGAAHGIKGEVRIASHTQSPEAIAEYGPLETDRPGLTVTIESARLQKTVLTVTGCQRPKTRTISTTPT